MARPAHTLVEFSGVFGSASAPIEEWSFGLRCSGNVAAASLQSTANAALVAYELEMGQGMRTDTHLTRVRVANITGTEASQGAGRIALNGDGSYQLADATGDVAGSVSAVTPLPTQTALVASLITSRNGPTGKGRIFLPFPGVDLDAGRLVTVGAAESIRDRVVDFLSTLNSIGTLGPVSVVSSLGYTSPVTGVRVGRVPDTQRSRRNRRDEGYVTASF